MTLRAASDALPETEELDPGVDFGRLKGRLVVPQADAFGSLFRIYLQFGRAETLQQILLERRHAAATRRSAGDIQDRLIASLGQPDETCLPPRATPAAARITWRRKGWVLHLIGFDDLGLGIITEDAERGDPLEMKPLGRSRDERFRSRQQRSLPRRILIRIHDANSLTLEPPACAKR
ncbi:hypothetical protein [Nisaea sp.]|uniref:hypothetical protein n=1 Tax=Nisaea sp. TaxID=2024842 RepID=UPI0032EB7E89